MSLIHLIIRVAKKQWKRVDRTIRFSVAGTSPAEGEDAEATAV